MPEENRPKVGVGIMIVKDGKVLLGRRRGSHGAGEFAFPGGHLEFMESFTDCVRRELIEECGLEVGEIRFQFLANVAKYAPKHYVHVGLVADWSAGEPRNVEPDKCDGWDWYAPDALPEPIFEMARLAFVCRETGQNFFDVIR